MRRAAGLIGLALMAGCVGPRQHGAGLCDARRVQAFIGVGASEILAERARRAAGAKSVRIITPGLIVTMDHRADRLNMRIDESGHVAALTCG